MHTPVLLKQVLELLQIRPGGVYVDGTLGGGGHAKAVLDAMGGEGLLIGIDRDPEALQRAADRISKQVARCMFEHGDFADMKVIAERHGISEVDGIVLDLGMSSDQVDTARRGFSFQQDGPLDMRMNPEQQMTAASLLATIEERELADLLYRLGEEHAARRIARAIVEERKTGPINSTEQLAQLVAKVKGGHSGRIHPATQTFQALRMAVNTELESLQAGLESGISMLKQGGRMAVISFHSLEDRVVKQAFVRHEGRWESLAAGGRQWVGRLPHVRRITRKPVIADEDEVRANPRARSAKLRVIERN
jgi:16S rRNA (cytosine1402-N4)-methyltransferase